MVFKKDFLDKIINITSNAAIACYPHLGKKDKVLVDKAATDEMRKNLNQLDINGEVVIKPMMYLALSYDHRIVDGKGAVTFLVRVKDALEDPHRLLMDI